uniref:Uncharacterized protein n=1 Tax=Strongyloides venezuelensis TaxID=75913 RepID=A0A0K0EZX1_STRVS
MLSNKPLKSPSTDSSNSESQENNSSKQQSQTTNCFDKSIIQTAPCDNLSVPSNNRQFIRHQLSATEEEHSSDDEESLVLRKKLNSKTKKDLHPLPKKSIDSISEKPPRGSIPSKSHDIGTLSSDMTGTNNNSTTSPSNPTPSSPQRSIHNRFAGAHASFRIRMLQEQHGVKKTGEPTGVKAPVSRKTSWSMETPDSKTIKQKYFFSSKNATLNLEKMLHHRNLSSSHLLPPTQPIIKDCHAKMKKKCLSIPSINFSLSDSEIVIMPEDNNSTTDLPPVSHHEFGHNKSTDHFTQQFAPLPKHGSVKSKGESEGGFFSPKRTFKMAHASFRNRIHREMYGLETVFMTKKRTRDTKSSEFQGGDLNKYTSRTYAIQNGNEIFGG